jgi:hypothetical protein
LIGTAGAAVRPMAHAFLRQFARRAEPRRPTGALVARAGALGSILCLAVAPARAFAEVCDKVEVPEASDVMTRVLVQLFLGALAGGIAFLKPRFGAACLALLVMWAIAAFVADDDTVLVHALIEGCGDALEEARRAQKLASLVMCTLGAAGLGAGLVRARSGPARGAS